LIPEAIAQGLIGHAYVCPDMIGGGELGVFQRLGVDPELFVRYAQCAALFPMMQFSASPARVLDAAHLNAVRAAVALHQQLAPEIVTLAQHAASTGEPILRSLAYHHPGYEHITDQFLLGENILAAPVLQQGTSQRTVVLPPGRWIHSDDAIHEGPAAIELPVTLNSVPWLRRAAPAKTTRSNFRPHIPGRPNCCAASKRAFSRRLSAQVARVSYLRRADRDLVVVTQINPTARQRPRSPAVKTPCT